MAYGKIKADSIIYDNSGSDVEKTIASLASAASTSSPTFTGTVTIPTPTAGDNTTKAASTAFVVAGFASKAANLLELNSGASSNANDSGIFIERGSTGDNAVFIWDESEDRFVVGTTTATNDATGNISLTEVDIKAGAYWDTKGNMRDVPQNYHNASSYTLVAADAGKHILEATNGATITVPNSVFNAGDCITIIAHQGSGTLTIAQGSGVTLTNAADAATGNRTLAARGMATIIFTAADFAYISGSGLS